MKKVTYRLKTAVSRYQTTVVFVAFVILFVQFLYFYLRKEDHGTMEMLMNRVDTESTTLFRRYREICGHQIVTPQCIYRMNQKVPFNPVYSDPGAVPGRCWISKRFRYFLYQSLQLWMKVASERNVTWWVTSGTLIGALRHRDVIPYDHDIDVAMLGDHEARIRNIPESKQPFHTGLNVRFRPGDYNGDRLNCLGHNVPFEVDVCSFNTPLARIARSHYPPYFFDVFATNPYNKTHFYPEGGSLGIRRKDTVFPLKLCSYMDMVVPCPQNSSEYMSPYYPDFHVPSRRCLIGQLWI